MNLQSARCSNKDNCQITFTSLGHMTELPSFSLSCLLGYIRGALYILPLATTLLDFAK